MNVKEITKKTVLEAEKASLKQIKIKVKTITLIFSAVVFIFKRPSYWKFIILSIFMNILAFIGTLIGIFLLFTFLLQRIEDLTNYNLNNGVDIVLYILFIFVSVYLTIILFTTIASVVNSPIYDALTDKILDEYNVENLRPYHGYIDFVFTTVDSLKFEVKKLLISLSFFVITLLLNSLPAIGNAFFVISNYMNVITMNGLDIMNPALTRNHVRFRSKVWFIIENPAIWPYLILVGIINAIPIVNIFTIPLTIVSSTMLYVEILKSREDN